MVMGDPRLADERQRDGAPTGAASGNPADLVYGLGAPVFVERRPGRVRVTCLGVTGDGPDRATAVGSLAARLGRRSAP
jgi:hypothetical protein